MNKIFFVIFTLVATATYGQKISQDILGDWQEVRREQRLGYVYNVGGTFMEPSIELSFSKDSTATFFNPQTPEPKSVVQYLALGDTLLAIINQGYLTVFDIEKVNNSELVLIWRSNKKWKDDNLDQRQHYIRKDRFDNLTETERNALKAPNSKDSAYLNDILIRKQKRNSTAETSDVLVFSEVIPSYPNGDNAMKSFLKKNIHRPKSFDKSGQVLLSFIVETNGVLTNIKIEKSLTTDCDNEAIRVIKLMPKWTPGMQNGKNVRVRKYLQVAF